MNGSERVRIPWKQRWRRFRHGTLPVLGFVVAAAATFYLWRNQGAMPQTIGEVESLRVDVTATSDGTLAPLSERPWALFEEVESNQVVARIDDTPIRAQLATLTEDLVRLQKELTAATDRLTVSEADRSRSHLSDGTRLQLEIERARLVVLERRIQVETDGLELERRNMRVSSLEPLFAKKLVSELEIKSERMLRDEVAKRLAANTKLLGEAGTQQKGAEHRLAQFPGLLAADTAKELAPIATAVRVQESRIREIEAAIGRLAMRAPIRGMICAIHRWPGANVRAGDPVLTIAAESGRYIVSYVRQEQRIRPTLGMAVEIRMRAPVGRVVQTKVERVGPQVEPIPLHQCRDPKVQEWGLPVRISMPRELTARPGELLEVTFKQHRSQRG
jgi:multidrug resistance efflux pump